MMRGLGKALGQWLSRRRGAAEREILLGQRRIYILPTRFGVLFAVVLLLMLTGSINYALSLGYILTFLLAALAISTILHTFRNLAGLRLTAARTAPVFAGDVARFPICIDNPALAERYSLTLARAKREIALLDVPAETKVIATATVAAPRRGVLKPGRLTISTRFPLGLFRAWAYLHLDAACIVYPRPAPAGVPLPRAQVGAAAAFAHARGSDDFAGLRSYLAGDSPRHVAWKAAARGQTLLTKQFMADTEGELWLRLDALSDELDIEEKVSRLARWVLEADAARLRYGLDLPGLSVPLACGGVHRERCLEALALFELPTSAPLLRPRRSESR
jgi:uncharacterized protein (DUF58 family)